MNGPFNGMVRADVISAITSDHMSPVGVNGIDDLQIKVTYELMLDQALKKERQSQIRDSQLENVEEPLTISRGKLCMKSDSLITNDLQFVTKISLKQVRTKQNNHRKILSPNDGFWESNPGKMLLSL